MKDLEEAYKSLDMMESLGLPVDPDKLQYVADCEHTYFEEKVLPKIMRIIEDGTKNFRNGYNLQLAYTPAKGIDTIFQQDHITSARSKQNARRLVTKPKEESSKSKAGGKLLKVTMPDGKVICEHKCLDTLIECIRIAGWRKVRDLNLQICTDNLILTKPHPNPKYKGRQTEIEPGVFITNCSNTSEKFRHLVAISEQLDLGWVVEIVNK